jgi:hypothetical protein
VVGLFAVLRTEPVPLVAPALRAELDSASVEVAAKQVALDASSEDHSRARAADAETPAGARATLTVSTLSGPDGAPAVGVAVSLFAPPADSTGATDAVRVVRTSDGDGRARFDVESGVEFMIVGETPKEHRSTPLVDVPALDPGEHRDVVLDLSAGSERRLFGRVQACESGAAVAGATVTMCRAVNTGVAIGDALFREVRLNHVTTDSDGRFELAFPTWRCAYLWIQAPGFGPIMSEISLDGSAPDNPHVACIDRSASLDVSFTDGFGIPIPSAKVRVVARAAQLRSAQRRPRFAIEPLRDIEWARTTDAQGRCRFEDLPAFVSLRAEAELPDDPRTRDTRDAYLRAGETNELLWTLGNVCRISGRIVGRDGAPLKHKNILLKAADGVDPCPLTRSSAYEDSTTADADGRFAFENVAAGRWWVGAESVSLSGDSRDPETPRSDPDWIAGFPIEVEIGETTRVSEVLLVVDPGLSIRGRVVDPGGLPARTAIVTAFHDLRGCRSRTQVGTDGAFLLGPLVSGTYRVRASWSQHHADSEEVVVAAGSDGVQLTLRAGGVVRGRVVGAKFEPRADATLRARLRGEVDPSSEVIGSTTRIFILANGEFALRGLAPGIYDVWATTADASFGWLPGVEVSAQREVAGLTLTMRPGAHLRLRCDDESTAGDFEVRVSGLLLYTDQLGIGFSKPLAVPPGLIQIAQQSGRESRHVQSVTIVAGEDRVVVVGKEP